MKTKLQKIMERDGVQPKDLAEAIDFHYKYVLSVINGSVVPGKKCALRISNYFDGEILPSELMGVE